jgi:hypothetical protein
VVGHIPHQVFSPNPLSSSTKHECCLTPPRPTSCAAPYRLAHVPRVAIVGEIPSPSSRPRALPLLAASTSPSRLHVILAWPPLRGRRQGQSKGRSCLSSSDLPHLYGTKNPPMRPHWPSSELKKQEKAAHHGGTATL